MSSTSSAKQDRAQPSSRPRAQGAAVRHAVVMPLVTAAGRLRRLLMRGAIGAGSMVGMRLPLSLRHHLTLFALLIGVPVVAFAAYLLVRSANIERVQYERQLRQTADDLAYDIDRDLQAMIVTLKTLATSRALRSGNYADFYAQTHEALSDSGLRVLLLTPDLHQIFNTLLPYGTPLPKPADQVTATRAIQTRQPQVSDYIMGVVSKRPILNVAVPVVSDGQVTYVLLMAFSPDRLHNILRGQTLAPGWITGVSDKNGVIIARSAGYARFLGKKLSLQLVDPSRESGVFEAVNTDGTPILRAVSKVSSAGWMVAATVDKTVATATARNSWLMLSLGGVALLLLGSVLTVIYGGALARATNSLTQSARALGRGEPVTSAKTLLVEANTIADELAAASHYRSMAEDALRDSEERIRLALNAAQMGYWEYDMVAGRVFWSPEMLRLFAIESFDGTPETARAYVHPDDRERVAAEFDAALQNQAPFAAEFRIIGGDGKERWLANSGRCDHDAAGKPLALRGVALDITERKQAELTNARLAAIVRNSGEAIMGLAPDGSILEWNPAAERLFGYGAAEAIGRSMDMIAGTQMRDDQARVLADLRAGRPVTKYETVRFAKDGRAIPVLITAGPIREGDKTTAFTATLTDISERKRAEEHQTLLLRELQHRTKNMLSVIQAIVARSLAGDGDVKTARTALLGRLHALARAHGELGAGRGQPALLGQLADAEMSPFASRHTIQGPPIPLGPQAAQTFALLIHELATNAAKYGALSVPHGRVAISWSLAGHGDGPKLHFAWEELDGPPVVPPQRRGFGRTILEQLVAQEFGAEPRVSYDSAGFRYAVEAPLALVQKDMTVPGSDVAA